MIVAALCGLWASAQDICTVTRVTQVTDSLGFFPQLNAKGTQVLYSTTDACQLTLQDVATGRKKVIASTGYPGFEAVFAHDGRVYYISQQRMGNNLIYRSAMEYSPVTGKTRRVLSGQHGAVHAILGSKAMAVVGERKSWNTKRAGVLAWTLRDKIYVVDGGKTTTLSPVSGSVGYLWASVSPDGSKICFEAAGKGVYVVNRQGRVLARLGYYMMPCWFGNNHIVAMNSSHGNIKIPGYMIYMLRADGNGAQALTDAKDGCIQPMVSGNKVICTTKVGGVRILDVKLN